MNVTGKKVTSGKGNKSAGASGLLGGKYRDMCDEERGLVPTQVLNEKQVLCDVLYQVVSNGKKSMQYVGTTIAPISMFTNTYPKTREDFDRLSRDAQTACRVGFVLNASLKAAEQPDEADLPEFDNGMGGDDESDDFDDER